MWRDIGIYMAVAIIAGATGYGVAVYFQPDEMEALRKVRIERNVLKTDLEYCLKRLQPVIPIIKEKEANACPEKKALVDARAEIAHRKEIETKLAIVVNAMEATQKKMTADAVQMAGIIAEYEKKSMEKKSCPPAKVVRERRECPRTAEKTARLQKTLSRCMYMNTVFKRMARSCGYQD